MTTATSTRSAETLRRLTSVAVACALAACGDGALEPATDVFLEPTQEEFVGDAVPTLALVNASTSSVRFGSCGGELWIEQISGSDWSRVPSPWAACALSLSVLKPGGTAHITIRRSLERPSTYRVGLVLTIDGKVRAASVLSRPFMVR